MREPIGVNIYLRYVSRLARSPRLGWPICRALMHHQSITIIRLELASRAAHSPN